MPARDTHTDTDLVQPVMVRMTSDLHAALKKLAAKNERTLAQEIRYALKSHISETAAA